MALMIIVVSDEFDRGGDGGGRFSYCSGGRIGPMSFAQLIWWQQMYWWMVRCSMILIVIELWESVVGFVFDGQLGFFPIHAKDEWSCDQSIGYEQNIFQPKQLCWRVFESQKLKGNQMRGSIEVCPLGFLIEFSRYFRGVLHLHPRTISVIQWVFINFCIGQCLGVRCID